MCASPVSRVVSAPGSNSGACRERSLVLRAGSEGASIALPSAVLNPPTATTVTSVTSVLRAGRKAPDSEPEQAPHPRTSEGRVVFANASHERLLGKGGAQMELDHSLATFVRKLGPLPETTTLKQGRHAGVHPDQ